ncbi:MAG: glutamate--tRNA ligase [Rhizobiales bacterium]|nr:glutamate--tRNA ligase [Hyphomicrobiales bacterium]NRB12798.1 glutamate--tRNA ligase [Hyphomicrobiales bacterium]
MSHNIITRFAPSPTGFLHIGGARTALFNWLYARGRNGKMLLRIEDTDLKRNTAENVQAIYDGMTWLGLEWDGDAISQNGNIKRHQQVVQTMLDNGTAYKCYASKDELSAMRKAAKAAGKPIKYDGTWRDKDASEAPTGIKPVIRFKAPQDGFTIINDTVQGRIKIANEQLDDLIMLRNDGTPTYMLSVVVDDHDMGVTHIIRGDDHLTNATRQVIIYNALGWDVPSFTHVPLIHGQDGAKLSKRHGAMGVMAYRDMGYLPEAMRNYLSRLSWSHGDDEIISTADLINWFDIDDIGKSPAKFDFVKLENINAHYIKTMDDEELVDRLERFLTDTNSGKISHKERLLLAMPVIKERAKTLVELNDAAQFIFADRPLKFDDKASKQLTDDNCKLIAGLLMPFAAIDEWTRDNVSQAIKQYAEQAGLKLGKIGQPLRAILAGTTNAPGIFDIAIILGKQETMARIADIKPS